jgi:hypothetical protein
MQDMRQKVDAAAGKTCHNKDKVALTQRPENNIDRDHWQARRAGHFKGNPYIGPPPLPLVNLYQPVIEYV